MRRHVHHDSSILFKAVLSLCLLIVAPVVARADDYTERMAQAAADYEQVLQPIRVAVAAGNVSQAQALRPAYLDAASSLSRQLLISGARIEAAYQIGGARAIASRKFVDLIAARRDLAFSLDLIESGLNAWLAEGEAQARIDTDNMLSTGSLELEAARDATLGILNEIDGTTVPASLVVDYEGQLIVAPKQKASLKMLIINVGDRTARNARVKLHLPEPLGGGIQEVAIGDILPRGQRFHAWLIAAPNALLGEVPLAMTVEADNAFAQTLQFDMVIQ